MSVIDTIQFHTPYFHVSEGSSLLEKTNEYIDRHSGEVVKSRTRYYNGLDFTVEIKDFLGTESLTFRTSVPKYLYGTQLKNYNNRDFEKFFWKVTTDLDGIGIELLDWSTVYISRLDFAKNIRVDQDIKIISGYLREFSPRYLKINTYNHTGVLWHNSRFEVCFYDKVLDIYRNELKFVDQTDRKNFRENWKYKNDIARFEVRLKRKKKIEEAFSRSDIFILSEPIEDRAGAIIEGAFDNVTKQHVDIMAISKELVDYTRQIKELFPRRSIDKILGGIAVYFLYHIMSVHKDILSGVLSDAGYSPRQIRRINEKVRELRGLNFMDRERCEKDEIYQEISGKIREDFQELEMTPSEYRPSYLDKAELKKEQYGIENILN